MVINDYISKLLKPTGVWKFLILNGPESAGKLIQGFKNSGMSKTGGGVLVLGKGVRNPV